MLTLLQHLIRSWARDIRFAGEVTRSRRIRARRKAVTAPPATAWPLASGASRRLE
jgi:hypothetical protein